MRSKDQVAKFVLMLHRYILVGYFKAAPTSYVRDAKVYQKILFKYFPQVANRLDTLVVPEAYCSKWFVGLNVHVLTFEALSKFIESLLIHKQIMLFQYAMGLVQLCEEDLMKAKDVSEVLCILRLDKSKYPNDLRAKDSDEDGSFFMKLVEDANEFDLKEIDLESLRDEVTKEMKEEEEKRKRREAELALESDDEIVFSDED